MDIKKIRQFLPHRYPMLLVDRIEECEVGKLVKGYKNVSVNEAFFQGHYPDMPIMPGVLILESMSQVGAMLLLADPKFEGFTPLVAGFNDVRFRRPVVPGDKLETVAEPLWMKRRFGAISAVASVDGDEACKAEILFNVLAAGESL